MLFILNWKGEPEVVTATKERFLKTGGLPPDGVKLLGRWHGIGALAGVAIVEVDDLEPLTELVLQWSDLLSFTVTPALTDEQAGKVLTQLSGRI